MTDKIGYSVEEAMQCLGIGRTTLYEAIADGRLRARKFGKRTLIDRADLVSFFETLPPLELDGRGVVKR